MEKPLDIMVSDAHRAHSDWPEQGIEGTEAPDKQKPELAARPTTQTHTRQKAGALTQGE